jgi:hypothetical protein
MPVSKSYKITTKIAKKIVSLELRRDYQKGQIGEFTKKKLETYQDCIDEYIADINQRGFTEARLIEYDSTLREEPLYYHPGF